MKSLRHQTSTYKSGGRDAILVLVADSRVHTLSIYRLVVVVKLILRVYKISSFFLLLDFQACIDVSLFLYVEVNIQYRMSGAPIGICYGILQQQLLIFTVSL